jgi:aminoglycoside 3-N-acetyltransferase I
MSSSVVQLGPNDVALLRHLNQMFGVAFDDAENYAKNLPDEAYLRSLLTNDTFIAIACVYDGVVVGGIAAYELKKFEQQRSEVYLYDLAVLESHRRQGVATSLVRKLQEIARTRGAHVIFVQADKPDDGAIAFYLSLTDHQEDVFHFDIKVCCGCDERQPPLLTEHLQINRFPHHAIPSR